MSAALVPVLLAGGEGRRLWPLSTPEKPKPFTDPLARGEPLLASTARRALALAGVDCVLTIGAARHQALLKAALDGVHTSLSAGIVTEPEGKNTAAAVALAVRAARRVDGDPVVALMPADHAAQSEEALIRALREACALAEAGWITCLGEAPDRAACEYGYILRGERIPHPAAFRAAGFEEKPPAARAKALIARGALWNAGIFAAKASVWEAEFRAHAPEIWDSVAAAWREGGVNADAWARVPALPIDRAVMEKTARMAVLPLEQTAGWADLGTWEGVRAFLDRAVTRRKPGCK